MKTRIWIAVSWLFLAVPALGAGLQQVTVQGQLLDESGKPLAAVLVFVASSGGTETTAVSDANGVFSVQLVSAEYLVFRQEGDRRTLAGRCQIPGGGRNDLLLHIGSGSSLAEIRDFEIGWKSTEAIQEQSLNDLVNPFPARKRGRLFGSLYEFHRNDNLDARNFFDPVGEPLPEYKRNQFGATAGYRWSDRWNFHGSYEGLRIIEGSTLLSHNPTVAMKEGDFSGQSVTLIDPFSGTLFDGNRIPADRIHPIARKMLEVIPDPNRPDPDRNYVNNDPRVRNQNQFNLRADQELSRGSNLVMEYFYTGGDLQRVAPIPLFSSAQTERHQELGVSYTKPVSERLLTFSRIEIERNRVESLSRNAGRSGLLESIGIEGLEIGDPLDEGYPYFDLTGYVDFGDQNSPRTSVRNRLSGEFSLTHPSGQHTLRAGVQMSLRQLNAFRSDGLHRGIFSFSGVFSGDSFADFLLGLPYAARRGVGSTRADLRHHWLELFLRDQWRFSPSFQLTLGVDYEFTPPWRSTGNNVSGFFPLAFEPPVTGRIVTAGSPEAAQLGLDGTVDGTLIFADYNDWAPSVGFAYNPFDSNRTVVRGSYGIWYQPPDQWYFTESLTRNYPFYFVESVQSSTEPGILLENPFASAAVPELTIRGVDPWIRNGYVQQWRLAVQGEPARNWTLEIAYSGRRGNSSSRSVPANVPKPGPGPIQERRPNPEFGRFQLISHSGAFAGHNLTVSSEKRLADGWSLRSGFEWHRATDDLIWGDPQDPRNLRLEKAPSAWVANKRLYLNYIVDLPFQSLPFINSPPDWLRWATAGWRLSGITEIQSGQPFTVVIPDDPNNDGVYGDRPDRIADGRLPADQRSVDRWFDTDAFRQPAPYAFGTAGRNILPGPGHQAWDISVIKQTRLADGDTLELRVELFNAFNQVNFFPPASTFGNSTFGKIFGADRAREIEVAVKYVF